MPTVDIVIKSEVSGSSRCKQLQAIFDVPIQEKQRLEWKGVFDTESQPWNVGLIVGPSGSGKSVLSRHLYAERLIDLRWDGKAVIDDFDSAYSIQDVSNVCQAVGFNTIPAWLRPYRVLSNGEKFRVDLARRLLELPSPIVVDEFTSVVDRQVAKIGAFAVQKYVRKQGKKFIGITCHNDVEEWLMPDWVLEMPTLKFRAGRSLQRRPELRGEIKRCHHSEWAKFSRYHYLTSAMSTASRCFELFLGNSAVAFGACLTRPSGKRTEIIGLSRVVTLPDWQGLGLAFVLMDNLGALYKAVGCRFHTYPAHPSLVRSMYRSDKWRLLQAPGLKKTVWDNKRIGHTRIVKLRPNAIFEYCGPSAPQEIAQTLTGRKAVLDG